MSDAAHPRLLEVEGLRGLAALGVLTYHVGQLTDGDGWLEWVTQRFWLGVPMFFVLSGFLLYRPFTRATLSGAAWPDLRRYGRARLLRIAPAYLVVLTVAIVVTKTWLTPAALVAVAVALWARALLFRTMLLVPAVATLLAALTMLGSPNPGHVAWTGLSNYLLLFQPLGPFGVVGPTWSLCIEISFYLALPFLALAIHHAARAARTESQRCWRIAVILGLALPVGALYLSFAGDDRPLPVWLPGYIDQFAIGMLLALGVERWRVASRAAGRGLLAVGVGVAVLAVPLYGVGPVSHKGNGSSVLYAPLMAVAFAFVIASLVLSPTPSALGRIVRSPGVVGLGVISYGVFLWHFPVIKVLQPTPLWTSEATNLAIVLVLTIGLATASWFLVERRALALKDAPLLRTRRPLESAAASRGDSTAASSAAAG